MTPRTTTPRATARSTRGEVGGRPGTARAAGFDTPAGSRGGRAPSARPLAHWLNRLSYTKFGRRIYRRLVGTDVVMLTTIGRKTGIARTTPVAGFRGTGGDWLIVASAGGTAANPAWYHNIATRPDQVQIEVGGRKFAVTAEQMHGAERASAWRQITASAPQFARFQRKTDRELPVLRLTPRAAAVLQSPAQPR